MKLNFTNSKIIIFAPMAGISDSPTRMIARQFGADVVVSGLISSEGLIRSCHKTRELAHFDNMERPVGLQLFGANPDSMSKAANELAKLAPDFIDINFGCPASKIVDKNGGSSVLRDLDLLKSIVDKVVQSVDIPVTVKMRAGWDEELTYLDAGEIIEDAGATAITIHPRTKVQGFSGMSDWNIIKQLKQHVSIPVIGNGDIFQPEDAKRMFDETGCDAIMIGRGAVGNPWLFSRVRRLLDSGELFPEPSAGEKIDLAIKHYDIMLQYYGVPRGVFIMRSQFSWYLKGLPASSETKSAINTMMSPIDVKEKLCQYRDFLNEKSLQYDSGIPLLTNS